MKSSLTCLLLFCFFLTGKAQTRQAVSYFPLQDIKLLESPFLQAQQTDLHYIMAMNPDRLLAPFLREAGLAPKAPSYTNWENTGLDGHIGGHYISALSMMYAATGDTTVYNRLNYMLNELHRAQQAVGNGFIGGTPGSLQLWKEIKEGSIRPESFSLNGKWVPLYNIHKTYAGLRDAYLYAGSDLARQMLIALTDWMAGITSGLTEQQMQDMLRSEHGGLNEIFADVADITGDKKYLELARRFSHKTLLEPLIGGEDHLTGMHANTQIPKVIGYKRIADLTQNDAWDQAARFFWNTVVNHRSVCIGGNSVREHFHPADNFTSMLNDVQGPETCNTYNMLKLTKHLFTWDPQAAYMDYYERALYNHILASQNPDDGMVCYSVPLESGTKKEFSTRFDSFWCCVASGIENHVKYAESVFFQSTQDDGLFINLFIPTSLNWREKGMKVKLETQFPADHQVRITFEGKSQKFPLHIRYPRWATQGIKATLNGKEETVTGTPGSYFTLNGEWGKDTELILDIPMELYTVSMPDNPNRMGIFYGPVLLAAPLGTEDLQAYEIPCFASDAESIISAIQAVPGKPLAFTANTTANSQLPLMPFYAIHGQKHAVYFDKFSTQEWTKKEKEYQALIEKQKELEARTTDHLRIGEMQPERDHDLQAENSKTGDVSGNKYRDAFNGWFSFTVKVDPTKEMQMLCSYWGADKDKRNFDILIDGKKFKTINLQGTHGPKVFEEEYAIPLSFTQGKEKVTVRFQSHPDCHAGGLFGFRMLQKR